MEQPAHSICNYYIDEAGDPVIFQGRRKKVIIGQDGCSNYFLMGLLHVPNPTQLTEELELLRQEIIADPYFANVPSLQPKNKKTFRFFHAKDDLPEIRKEVFGILRKHNELQFFGVVKNKWKELEFVKAQQEKDPAYRYNPNHYI